MSQCAKVRLSTAATATAFRETGSSNTDVSEGADAIQPEAFLKNLLGSLLLETSLQHSNAVKENTSLFTVRSSVKKSRSCQLEDITYAAKGSLSVSLPLPVQD